MNILINGEIAFIDLPEATIEKLLELRGVRPAGTAVAVNNKLVKKENWALQMIHDGDAITIISGAFGG